MKIIYSGLLFVALSACSILGTSESSAMHQAIDARAEVEETEIHHVIKSVALNPTEMTIVNHAFNAHSEFWKQWDVYIHDPDMLSKKDKILLYQDYQKLIERYLELERVVGANWNKYSVEKQHKLLQLREDAYHLHDVVEGAVQRHKFLAALHAIKQLGLRMLEIGIGAVYR